MRAIVITGCSSGIGRDAALTMKARGWRVIATARQRHDLDRLISEDGVEALPLELSDPNSIAECAIAALEMTGGKVDALFSNAAYAQPGAVEDLRPELLRQQFNVNLIGTHDLTRRFIPQMRRNGFGRIVQCSSVLGLMAVPYRGAYCASKFALEALSDAMRLELKGSGISVSLIEPGPIRSRFVENALAHFQENIDIEGSAHCDVYRDRIAKMQTGGKVRFKLEPAAVSKRLVHAVESRRPRRRYYVTTPTYIAAGMRRLLPTALTEYFSQRF